MIFTMTHKYDLDQGRYSILACQDIQWWVMEREWKHNRRNVSCVPRDSYALESHSSTKYPDTWALIGPGVSHWEEEGIPRFACVLHRAVFPTDLEGCLTVCKSVDAYGMAIDAERAMHEFRAEMHRATGSIKILMQ